MAGAAKDKLARLKERIEAQNGTVVVNVSGEVEISDTDGTGAARKGPVLVLNSIEKGAVLRLAHPRPVVVLGSVYGQVCGAYTVKAGNLLSGCLEGVRHVEIAQDLGSLGDSTDAARVVFDITSDPGFFGHAQRGLDRLQVLERENVSQREAMARMALLRTVKSATFDIKVFISTDGDLKPVFSVHPARKGREVEIETKALLRYLMVKAESKTEAGGPSDESDTVQRLKEILNSTIAESLRLASSGGMGAALRQQRGQDSYAIYVDAIEEYLLPKLLGLWSQVTRKYTEGIVDRLMDAPMIIEVKGQISPFFQFEYSHLKFYVSGTKIVPEKMADCTVVCQLADDPGYMRMTYTYTGEEESFTKARDFPWAEMKGRSIILKQGYIYFSGTDDPVFGPIPDEAEG
jgi:hypothetical protein